MKRRGSSLIYVIIVFMFVIVISMAMISMVSGNYKSRISESKRIENIYASESGINTAYNIMAKTFDAGVRYANQAREKLGENINSTNYDNYTKLKEDIDNLEADINSLENDIKNIRNGDSEDKAQLIAKKKQIIAQKNLLMDEDKNVKEILEKEEFKRAFKNFIEISDYKGIDEYIPNKLKESVENEKYVIEVNGIESSDLEEAHIDYSGTNKPTLNLTINKQENDENNKKIISIKESDGHYHDVKFNIYEEEKPYVVTIKSSFNSIGENNNIIGKNLKIISATYTLKVPNYNDIFFEQGTDKLYQYAGLYDKGIVVGGNMIVDGINRLTVNDDIFVQGNYEDTDDNSSNRVYDKYIGGIVINNIDSNVKFNKNVVTRGTLNIRDNVESADISGNLYAANIFAGNPESLSKVITKSNLNIDGDAIIDNDLSLSAIDTHINITNYYGINDKNILYKDLIENKNSNPNEKYKSSSSIIINKSNNENGDKPSTITITNNAYLMGTAYIATNGNYQTGESIAVKGNYSAYSYPIDIDEKFIYDNPLYLLDEDDVFKKAEHFKEYWESRKNNLKSEGIILPSEIYSVGAVVYASGDKVSDSTYTPDKDSIIKSKRAEYASRVYYLDNANEINENDYIDIYNSFGKDCINVDDIIQVPNDLSKYDYDIRNQQDKSEKAIFNNDKDTIIVIKRGFEDNIQINEKEINIIVQNNILKSVIATNGKLIIDGDITINGNIITNHDLEIKGDGEVKINKDNEIIERIQAENIKLFNDTFGSTIKDNEKISESITTVNAKYNLSNFIKKSLWKIVK